VKERLKPYRKPKEGHYAFPYTYSLEKFKYNYKNSNKKVNLFYKIEAENLNEDRDLKALYDIMLDCKNSKYNDQHMTKKAQEDWNYVENLYKLSQNKPNKTIINALGKPLKPLILTKS
jgi:hypothetical protein